MHVDRFAKLRMVCLDRPERSCFARLGTLGPGRASLVISHVEII
jgi:hypothetical protein